MSDNCRDGDVPGTNGSGIREGEEYLQLESERRMKHPVKHHTVCVLVPAVFSCRTVSVLLLLLLTQQPLQLAPEEGKSASGPCSWS